MDFLQPVSNKEWIFGSLGLEWNSTTINKYYVAPSSLSLLISTSILPYLPLA